MTSLKPIATPVIVVSNSKGGACKTSLALNLAGAWVARGMRVLCLDLDSQGNLSQGLGYQGVASVASVFSGEQPTAWESRVPGLHLLAADRSLSSVVPGLETQGRQLRRVADYVGAQHEYDLIVIDTPPSLGGLTLAALVAATHVVIPLSGQYFALKGTADMLATLAKVRQAFNPGLSLLAAVVALHRPGTALAANVVDEYRRQFGPVFIPQAIPRSIVVEESQVKGFPVEQAFPRTKVAQAYREVAGEILRRLNISVVSQIRESV